MTIRVDSTSLISGKTVISLFAGHGIQAQSIPSIGNNGPGYLYNDIASEGSAATDEMRGEILTWPSAGVMTVNEDSSFSFTGAPDGTYSATYRGFRNGVSYGEFNITMTIGASSVQSVSSSATLTSVCYAIAQSGPANRQFAATTADLLSNASAQATTTTKTNSQNQQSTGQVVSFAQFIASTSWVNTAIISNVQNRQTSATARQILIATTQTAPKNSQHQQTAGQASTVTRFVATTSWLNKIIKVAAYTRYIKTRSITKKTYQTSTRQR